MLLAIDPGNTLSAYVLMDGYKPIDFGKVENRELQDKITNRGLLNLPKVAAIEMVASQGKIVGREVFETCFWIGRYSLAVEQGGMAVELIYRYEIKRNLCGDVCAKDANITHALIDRFAEHDTRTGKGTKKNRDFFYGFKADIWQAYAVGVTYLDTKGATQ